MEDSFFFIFEKKEIVKEMKCAGPVFRNTEIETKMYVMENVGFVQ